LLDEPAAGMNPQETMELMDLLRELRDKYSLTMLLIEHDMKFVMRLCERIKVLDYGNTIAEGSPSEIQSDPDVIKAYLGTVKTCLMWKDSMFSTVASMRSREPI